MPNATPSTKRDMPKKKKAADKSPAVLAARRRLAAVIRGKYAWIPDSVDDFVRDKRREIALEDRA